MFHTDNDSNVCIRRKRSRITRFGSAKRSKQSPLPMNLPRGWFGRRPRRPQLKVRSGTPRTVSLPGSWVQCAKKLFRGIPFSSGGEGRGEEAVVDTFQLHTLATPIDAIEPVFGGLPINLPVTPASFTGPLFLGYGRLAS